MAGRVGTHMLLQAPPLDSESCGGAHCVAPEAASKLKAHAEDKLHMHCFICADDLMKPHGFVWVVRKWHSLRTDPVHGCFDDPEGLNNGYLPSGRGPRVHEVANDLRLGTTVLSLDLSGAWVTF
jgi:hypothetical protein